MCQHRRTPQVPSTTQLRSPGAPEWGRSARHRQLRVVRPAPRPAPRGAREVHVPAHDAHLPRRRLPPGRRVAQQARHGCRPGQEAPRQVHAPGTLLQAEDVE